MEELRLNLGCARQTPAGWVNVDYALGARIAKLPLFRIMNKRIKIFNVDWSEDIYLHNLTKTFPWDTNSVSVIYSSHTLEHLSRKDGRKFISECFRVLKLGGVVRIVVPDLSVIVERYRSGDIQADHFLDELHVSYEQDGDSKLKKTLAPLIRYPHRCMYDTKTLLRLLSDAGFSAEARAAFESKISGIDSIELSGRATDAVIVEGVK